MSVHKYVKADGKTSWYYVFDVETETGSRQRHKKRGFATERAAKTAEAKARTERASGEHIPDSQETVGELLTRWLHTVARHKVRATTLADYELTVRVHLVPHIGTVRVQKLTAARVQAMYSTMLDAGAGKRTVHLAHQRLRQALTMAEREGIVRRNVCDLVDPPTSSSSPGQSWTADEARRFLDTAKDDSHHPLWLLALATGMRRGELLGLRWQDVDLSAGTVRVAQSVRWMSGKPVVMLPKTESSVRTIGISKPVVDALKDHRKAWLERKLQARTWDAGDLVFCTRFGQPINPSNLYRNLAAIITAAGVPKLRLHDMRHTHATLLLAGDTPIRAVSARLGHSQTSVTMNIYAHVLQEMQDRAITAIDSALFPVVPDVVPNQQSDGERADDSA